MRVDPAPTKRSSTSPPSGQLFSIARSTSASGFGIGDDPARGALVAGMVHFAGQTGATLVAEGVETAAEARKLTTLGVRLTQGYYLGRPAVAGRLVRLASFVHPPTRPARRRPAPGPRARLGRSEEIERAVNVGPTLGATLREVGVASIAELQATGAIPARERLRRSHPGLATTVTLLKLEAAAGGFDPLHSRMPIATGSARSPGSDGRRRRHSAGEGAAETQQPAGLSGS